MIPPLSQTYGDARAAFREAAAAGGARIDTVPHPLRGLEDEDLSVDIAEVGPADNTDVILVFSGTHGVEGYLGSALQRHHLETLDAAASGGPTLVFVHALNPYGFSWVRRVNEDNVDLNRNFVDWSQERPPNDEYGEIADVLVPTSWSEEEQQRTLGALLEKVEEVGMERAQQIISGGQYEHPTGIFYGGTGPTWSNRWLNEFLTRRLAAVDRAVILDLHTGLGPWGHGELISFERPGSPGLARQKDWWTGVVSLYGGSSVSAEIAGDWVGTVAALVPDVEVTGVAIEYGTVDPISVMQGLRADAVLHAHGDPRGPDAAAIRAHVRSAFLDDDPEWLQQCWPRYRDVVTSAIEHLG